MSKIPGGRAASGLLTGLMAGLLAGCAASAATAPPPAAGTVTAAPPGTVTAALPPALGSVTGRLQIEGGPSGLPAVRPLPGTVQFARPGHRPVTVSTGASGRFTARLAPGAYQVSGRSPHIREQLSDGRSLVLPCTEPATVTVAARRTVTVTLSCIVP